jgi:hypothetical protein
MDLSALESISKALEESLDFWGLMLLLATALVVIGLVIEYWHDVQEFWVRLTWPMASFPWDKFTALVGGILVTIGVAGELFVTYKASRVETKLRDNSHKIEAFLTQKAGDAATSAKTAHDEANAVKQESAIIEERLEKASTQLADLEQEILLQGPRWGMLKRSEKTFIEALRPFKGQKATVVICGQGETERFVFEQVLLDLLRKAGWSTGYQSWKGCPTMLSGGNEIYFVSAADTIKQWVMPYPCSAPCPAANEDKLARAGRALCDLLRKLRIGTEAWMESPPRSASDEESFSRARLFFENGIPGGPAELALREPSTIFILVGPHPPEFGLPQSRENKAKHIK